MWSHWTFHYLDSQSFSVRIVDRQLFQLGHHSLNWLKLKLARECANKLSWVERRRAAIDLLSVVITNNALTIWLLLWLCKQAINRIWISWSSPLVYRSWLSSAFSPRFRPTLPTRHDDVTRMHYALSSRHALSNNETPRQRLHLGNAVKLIHNITVVCFVCLFVWCLTAHQHKKAISAKNRWSAVSQ